MSDVEIPSQRDRLLSPAAATTDTILRKPIATANSRRMSDFAGSASLRARAKKESTMAKARGTWHLPQTWWGFELAAIALSCMAFAALTVVLQTFDGQPQQAWPYNHLTLNGLVALLSTFTRTALLVPVAAAISQEKWLWFFPQKRSRSTGRPLEHLEVIDQASRGAWGSLKMIWTTKARHSLTLGGLLMVLSLGFDTFSQQILSVRFRSVVSGDPGQSASFARSEVFGPDNLIGISLVSSPGATVGPPVGVPGFANTTGVSNAASLALRAAVANGILGGNVPELSIHCSTGKCTWPTVPTLGMCGGCTDVTGNLTKTCGQKDFVHTGKYSFIPNGTESYCNYSLPSGVNFLSTISKSFFGTITMVSDFVVNNTYGDVYSQSVPRLPLTNPAINLGPYFELLNKTPDSVGAIIPYVANFESIYAPWNKSGDSRTQIAPINENVSATECALWLCVQAYNVSVNSGRPSQSMIKSWSRAKWMGLQGDEYKLAFKDLPTEFNIAPESNFSVALDALTNLYYLFGVSSSVSQAVQNFTCDASTPDCHLPTTGNNNTVTLGTVSDSSLALAIWESSQDWDKWIQGIARSVTNNIRTYSSAPNDTEAFYAGQAYLTESYIHVRWAWIAYPAAMVFGSLVYLLIVIWQSRRSRTYECYAWKDSALALLSVSLDQDTMDKAKGALAKPGELSERIGRDNVVLENDWGTLALHRVD